MPSQPAQPATATATAVWLAVRTKPRAEAQAQQQLQAQGFTVFNPTITERKRRQNRWQVITGPLFPGYLFIQVALGQQDTAVVRSTPGVLNLVRFGQQLVPVPGEVIALLQSIEQQGGHNTAPPHQPGDKVAIIDGPFAGITAIYKQAKGEQRAIMLIEMLGKLQPVAVTIDQLGEVQASH